MRVTHIVGDNQLGGTERILLDTIKYQHPNVFSGFCKVLRDFRGVSAHRTNQRSILR